jgi:hypothetical protein
MDLRTKYRVCGGMGDFQPDNLENKGTAATRADKRKKIKKTE